MTSVRSETETVIKKILPYLKRRGYDPEKDFDYETSVTIKGKSTPGRVDVVVNLGKSSVCFIIEAKKTAKPLTDKDKDQALGYGRTLKAPFVVLTNGRDIKSYNTQTGEIISWSGKESGKVPTRTQLTKVLADFKKNPLSTEVSIGADATLPYRPGLPLKQVNALFQRCHNAIRKIEKNEENAFADFSKLLFLKLLEEKAEIDDKFKLPYSFRFHDLAEKPEEESDQIQTAIETMIAKIRSATSYGEVLEDGIKLKNSKTFRYIVQQLASVSFQDSSIDSKGAAFEYFVRATLKGKKLGQYFTPRPVVELMHTLIGKEKIIGTLSAGENIKVLDPACGTGGFLVYLMQESLKSLDDKLASKTITQATFNNLKRKLRESTFFGSDANPGVAASAKMNMIIAGDGHSNIQAEDSLSADSINWDTEAPDCHIIITNPPFGTSESMVMTRRDKEQFDIQTTKGQLLFIQKIIKSTLAGGDICTVIDEGVLNTDSASEIRRLILQNCRIKAIVRLPDDTFKPNKINVKSSILYLQKLETPDYDLDDNYKVTFYDIESLGYYGSGELIRNYDLNKMMSEIYSHSIGKFDSKGYNWSSFEVDSKDIISDSTHRIDYKYWNPEIIKKIELIRKAGITIKDANQIKTRRGKSPPADLYVDKEDGYALVVKSGTNISRFGRLILEGDYIEKEVFEDYKAHALQDGDVLLASTGDGTLGKSCVYRSSVPAIPDGHVTVIRLDQTRFYPEYVSDYLREGFGSEQVSRLFSGSTGLIELTPEQINTILIDSDLSLKEQKSRSNKLRTSEDTYIKAIDDATRALHQAREETL